ELIQIFPAMIEHEHTMANGIDYLVGNFALDKLFAIARGSRDNCTIRIDDRGGAAESNSIICSHSIRQDKVALVFDRTGQKKDAQMLDARKGPRRRVDEYVYVMFDGKRSAHLGKSQIVAD